MPHTLCHESRNLAHDLYQLLMSLDPARLRQDMEHSARERLAQIRRELRRILDAYQNHPLEGRLARLYEALQALSVQLEEARSRGLPSLPARRPRDWSHLRRRLQPAYGALAACLEHLSTPVPSLRPTNYTRSLFHMACSLGCLVLLQHVLAPEPLALVAVSVAVWAWTMEILRVHFPVVTRVFMKVLGPIAHPHEHHKVNSSTWYISAVALLATLFPPAASAAALVVLGFGDPAASTVGRRFGRIRFRSGRSLEGSLAFAVAGTLAAALVLGVYYPALGLGGVAAVAATSALSGAAGELLSGPLDDNFTVPLAAAAGAALALGLLA